LLATFSVASLHQGAAPELSGSVDDWNGYRRYSFQHHGRQCYIVAPHREAGGRPWIWRARFWGHRPEVDLALLGQGFHLAYMDVIEMPGNREAVSHWNAFYKLLAEVHGFTTRPALEGMSRGGLYVCSWAAKNSDKVACIYADAPVCDIAALGLDKRFPELGLRNPIDHLEPLAKARVPLLHVSGDADTVVPLEKHTRVLEARYRALGGDIRVIIKPGVGHKHGLDDPAPIIEFILKHTLKVPNRKD
jgi:pimeloyl-ACP methyl ester carboxylesterase